MIKVNFLSAFSLSRPRDRNWTTYCNMYNFIFYKTSIILLDKKMKIIMFRNNVAMSHYDIEFLFVSLKN